MELFISTHSTSMDNNVVHGYFLLLLCNWASTKHTNITNCLLSIMCIFSHSTFEKPTNSSSSLGQEEISSFTMLLMYLNKCLMAPSLWSEVDWKIWFDLWKEIFGWIWPRKLSFSTIMRYNWVPTHKAPMLGSSLKLGIISTTTKL